MKKTLLTMAIVQLAAVVAMADGAPSLTTTVVNDEKESLLADSAGHTLYTFDMDKGQAVPTCNASCAELWPPYLITAEEAATLKAPLGQVARANKKLQLTYNGQPVYGYAYDRGQGADSGDGIGGVWHYIELK